MKKIKGFENYGITSCGRVWSFKSNKFLKPRINRYGYFQVSLCGNGKKTAMIHRLVAEAYIPNPNNYDTVDHIDNIKAHNYIGNLQWLTHADNNIKGHSKKIRCVELDIVFPSQRAAAEHFGCTPTNISHCLRGKTKTACGFHWEVIE